MTTSSPDPERVAAFAGHMFGIVNSASLALLTSIGYETDLFETMAKLPPSTSDQIAAAAGLHERYVREWLAGMVGHIIEYAPQHRTYALPPAHAQVLTHGAGPDNLAVYARGLMLLAHVVEEVIDCFRRGGGVPYSAYKRFGRLSGDIKEQSYNSLLVPEVLPSIPGLVERLRAGIDVADIGCGTGHALNVMAQAFPISRFVGYDFLDEGIAAGRAEAERMGLSNARFEHQDMSLFDTTDRFDFITTFDAIHDMAHPARPVHAICAALRAGGTSPWWMRPRRATWRTTSRTVSRPSPTHQA